MKIQNRRYTGSKYKLMPWIKTLILENCPQHDSLFDVFGGTGVVTAELLDITHSNVINDFLYSNEIIYKAFFSKAHYRVSKLKSFQKRFAELDEAKISENYVSKNYGGKYFEEKTAKKIGFIREDIELNKAQRTINEREYCILLASLLYSLDRCANTVGHYEAYLRGKTNRTDFEYELVDPIKSQNSIQIYRKDANELARMVVADIAFIDPPYNSRQYSRFYHVLETITKWDKPKLVGTALKPPEENMSEYCRNSAPAAFADLISQLHVKYIVVTYNNTYDSKSSSSKNKITLEQILEVLENRGETKVFEQKYHRFNAGKTDSTNHKEFVFITKVNE